MKGVNICLFGIATDIVGAASPLARKGMRTTTGLNYFNAGNQVVGTGMSIYEDFTPAAVGFDEVLFNTLTTIDYGDGKLFVDNGNTLMGSQIGLRDDIANSGSVEDVSKLANSYIEATSSILKAIANGMGFEFSNKKDRQEIMDAYTRNKEVFDRIIKIYATRNLTNQED